MKTVKDGNAAKMALLHANVDAAKSRLKQAQIELNSVLTQLPELPAALKTGVMRAIENAFQDLGHAEEHLLDMEDAVSVQLSASEPITSLEQCPHCLRPYDSALASSREAEARSGRQR